MKKNIRIVLLGELILFIVIFLCIILTGGQGLSLILCFIDSTSLILIMMFLIPGLIIMGEWKDLKAGITGKRKTRSVLIQKC